MKSKRQAKILELIRDNVVNTQEGLLILLREAGYDVTQATVSRDIKEMKLSKKTENGVYRYAVADIPPKLIAFQEILFGSVVAVDYAVNTVVLRCQTGMAQAACAALDSFALEDVVGTLAGDDTIFALTRSEAAAKRLASTLESGIFVKKNLKEI